MSTTVALRSQWLVHIARQRCCHIAASAHRVASWPPVQANAASIKDASITLMRRR